ncbi:MAG: OmpA family protein [Bdellovibrio sp.]
MKTHVTTIGSLILSLVLCASAQANDATKAASENLGASMVSEVSFDQGRSTLNDSAKSEIRKIVDEAKQKGKIDELKVAAWADREYPTSGTKASKQDIDLADERARSVKNFIKDDLQVGSVNTYNMTERPNALQKFMRTDTAKTKTAMENTGAAPRTSDETGLFNQKAKSSKAVIMVYVK